MPSSASVGLGRLSVLDTACTSRFAPASQPTSSCAYCARGRLRSPAGALQIPHVLRLAQVIDVIAPPCLQLARGHALLDRNVGADRLDVLADQPLAVAFGQDRVDFFLV